MYVDIRDLFGRQSTDCGQGTQFYRCGNNNFAGCCSVDPCALPACPDDEEEEENGDDKDTGDDNGGGDDEEDQDDTEDEEETDGGGGSSDTTSPDPSPETTETDAETTSRGTPTTSLVLVTRTAANGEVETTSVTTVITPGVPAETGDGSAGPESDDTGGPATDSDASSGGISKGAIAGISVGVILAIIIFAVAFYLFLRRRKKRAGNVTVLESSSGRMNGNLDGGGVAAAKLPDASSTPGSMAMAQGQENDPFAPFGGKYDPRASNNGPNRTSQVSSMADTTMPASPTTAVSGKTTSVDGTQAPQGPALLDSTQVKPTLEMDASDAAVAKKPAVVEMDATPSPRSIPETQSSASSVSLSPVPASLRPGGGDPRRLSPNVPPTVEEDPISGETTRATLDPTPEEKKGRRSYVTSWSQYEGAPEPSR